ncbi:MAG: phytanoyl-CoA dioxygenase family protein [Alphaproteobacteria bacterium]
MHPAHDYQRDGYVSPIRVLSRAEALGYRARMEAHERAIGRPLNRLERTKPHLLFGWAAELARHPAVLAPVQAMLGPDLLCWETVLFTKEANGPEHITWHQDVLYWGLEPPDEVVTAWVALSPSNAGNGCMRVVPGSHRLDLQRHVDTYADGNLLSRGQVIVDVDEADAVDVTLEPGEMSIHHVKIIHGSDLNRSGDRRIGFAARYFTPRVRQRSPARDSAFLASGTDAFGHFDLEPAPEADYSPAVRARHEQFVIRRRKLQAAL